MNFQGVGHFRNLFNQEILFHLSTSALTKKLKKKKKNHLELFKELEFCDMVLETLTYPVKSPDDGIRPECKFLFYFLLAEWY